MIQSRFVFYFARGCLLFSHCYMQDEISLLAEREHVTPSETSSVSQGFRFASIQDKNIITHRSYCTDWISLLLLLSSCNGNGFNNKMLLILIV